MNKHKIEDYLPISDKRVEVAAVLKEVEADLWVIGSNLRRIALRTNSGSAGYDFLCKDISADSIEKLNSFSKSHIQFAVTNGDKYTWDFDAWDLSILFMNVEDFLCSCRFAGDAMCMKVTTQQVICRPFTGIYPLNADMGDLLSKEDGQVTNTVWVEKHKAALDSDYAALLAAVKKELDAGTS